MHFNVLNIFYLFSGASTVAIDNKIEQAMVSQKLYFINYFYISEKVKKKKNMIAFYML